MIFSKEIKPACGICRYAKAIYDNNNMNCRKKGIVSSSYSCRRYEYDPLKRIPKPKPVLQKYSAEDFSLD